MTTLTSISRHSRVPAILLLASYSILVVMLAVHHHHARAAQFAITLPQPVETGHHSAIDCPITHHAQQAFLAVPTTSGSSVDISLRAERVILPPAHAIHANRYAPTVRGPPPCA